MFITIFPDERENLIAFFDNNSNKWWPLCGNEKNCMSQFNYDYILRFGFIAWENIIEFCSQNNLTDAKNVFEFNKGQIC